MSARENGMHSSITKADIQEAYLQGYHFEERLHCARKEAESVKRSIPWSEVTPHDVLSGRGSDATKHPGNIFFRKRCEAYSEDYFQTPISRRDQRAIRHKIVDEVLSTGGRFLEPCSPGRNDWKNIIGENKKLREKIQNRMRDIKESPLTVADAEEEMDSLDMNSFFDRDKHLLDAFAVNETHVISDLKDADSDDDHPTVAYIVLDMSPTSAMVDLNRHLDQDKLVLDWSHTNEAYRDDARPQTVADTEGNICPVDNLDRNTFLHQDKLSLDVLAVNETIVNSDLNDADSVDDHPTAADIVVDMSPTSAMVSLDRNRHLDRDKLVLDWCHMNEANWDDARPQTVADTEGDIRPTSEMENLDRKTFLHQDKFILDASNLQEARVNFELDEADLSKLLSF